MISTDTVRKLLAVADVAKDPYAVAAGAASLLAAGGPAAQGVLEFYVRALVAMKLQGAAARLAPGSAHFTAAAPGSIAWSSRARRFAANLKAMEARGVTGVSLVADAAKNLSSFELYQSIDGNYQVLDTTVPVFGGWVGGLVDHKNALAWGIGDGGSRIVQPLAFDGVGFGWSLMQFLTATANSFLNYSCAVYVLANDPLALAMALHLHDWQELIARPRVRWFLGTSAETVLGAFQAAFREHPTWTLPGQSIRCALRASAPAAPITIEAAVVTLRDQRAARLTELRSVIAAQNAGRDAAWWHRRFAEASSGGRPLRVLGLTSRFTTVLQYSMEEFSAAARAAGMDVDVAIEPDDQSLENPFLEKIAAMQPDLIVQLSRMRYENPQMPGEIPFLTWDQDNLPCMRTPEAKASLGALTFVAGHGAIFGYGHLEWPQRNCIFCHPAGAAHRYHDGPVPAELLSRHACDISYVSNASAAPEALHVELRQRWAGDAYAEGAFDACCRDVLDESLAGTVWDDIAMRQLMEEKAKSAGLALSDGLSHELLMDIHRYADRCFRHATLTWVSRWCIANGKTFKLYGRGWQDHPDLGRWAAGVAEPGEPFGPIFQASRINLQLIESGFIHSRALDGLAAGGFFLTRHVTADGDDPDTLRDLHLLGKWVVERNITTPEQMTATTEDEIPGLWKRMLEYHHWTPAHAVKVLRVWAETPHAVVAFPMLPQVSFHDETSFGRLASHFLTHDAARKSMAREMRQITLDQFSYDSRLKQFIGGILAGLAVA